MIRKIRIEYDKPHAQGLFVIRCSARGEIRGENSSLAYRQQRHGAGVTQKPPTTRRIDSSERANTTKP